METGFISWGRLSCLLTKYKRHSGILKTVMAIENKVKVVMTFLPSAS